MDKRRSKKQDRRLTRALRALRGLDVVIVGNCPATDCEMCGRAVAAAA